MPIITIHHKAAAPLPELGMLRERLPDIVSRAVECAEEPYDGKLKAGDINILATASLATTEDLDYIIEIKTGTTNSRLANVQERADAMSSDLEALGLRNFGIWLELSQAAWGQK
jgi:hypothetical protein